MAKPIFLVQIPDKIGVTQEQIYDISKSLQMRLHDYHTLVIQSSVTDIRFGAYYDKDLIEVDFNLFKEMVMNQFKK